MLSQIKNLDEKQFIKMVLEYKEKSYKQNRTLFTHFYNKEWMQNLLKQYMSQDSYSDIKCTFIGGYEAAERQMLAISPYEVPLWEYPISILRIHVKMGIGKALTHRDYLGALLGLGIERSTIGDIILYESGAYIIVETSMVPYISSQLTSIGKYQKIEINEIKEEDMPVIKPKTKCIQTTVSALRMDVVCASAFGLSRSACAKLIQCEKARCNGTVMKVSDMVKEGDYITLRGHGKVQLVTINGKTKKDRICITIEKYI